MKIELPEKKSNQKELIPQIVERIFLTCKNDPSFHLKDEIEIVENKAKSLQQKIEKQDYFLKEAEKMEKDLQNRVEILDNENSNKQIELLEELGSEL